MGLNVDMAVFRSYDPALGRWQQTDPLCLLSPAVTPYRFGFNNPVIFGDPSGLWETIDGGWRTTDLKEISEYIGALKQALATGGEVNYYDVGEKGVAFTMWSIGEKGSFHATLHQNRGASPSGSGVVFAFQSSTGSESELEESTTRAYAHARSLSIGWAFGGGFGFEVGKVTDQRGESSWYFRSDARIGLGGGASYNATEIIPSTENTFIKSQWEGYDNYTEFALGPAGYGWGANQREWGKEGDPLLNPGARAGDLYTIRNIPVGDLRDLRGITASPARWGQAAFKGAKVGAYRFWGKTWLF